ncbi:MAG: cell division protein FtsZ, partial [Cyclobacteriaceae bacterium]|nr:cell division protein FtsZ [Cyclobacteriaceae bacterium]
TVSGYVNVDFEDVKTVMKDAGAAVMGSAQTYGDNRARRAAEAALNSPLLNNQNIVGAQKILLSIMSGEDAELQMDELTSITDYIQEFAGDDADVIFGHGIDPGLGEYIRVTVIATGFEAQDDVQLKRGVPQNLEDEPIRMASFQKPAESRLTKKEVEEEEKVKRVYDLNSSRQISQRSLFDDEEKETEREIEFEITNLGKTSTPVSHEEEDDDEISFDFEFDFPEKEEEQEALVFDFEDDFEDDDDMQQMEEEDAELEELTGMAHPSSRKFQLMEERRNREETLDSVKRRGINSETFKEKWDVPAYERKKVVLQQVPHSTERNISRFSLNDDNQLFSNNRFLHDNVD